MSFPVIPHSARSAQANRFARDRRNRRFAGLSSCLAAPHCRLREQSFERSAGYLPRLKDDVAFQTTVGAGADSRDFFGIAQGMDEGRYVGFSFGKKTSVFMDSSLLLIEPVTAAGFAEAQRAAEEARKSTVVATGTGATPPRVEDPIKVFPAVPGASPQQPPKRQFYGSIELDPIQAKKQFADLVEEVVLQFTAKPGVKVRIAIEIQAETETGFDDNLQRAVKENCKVLKFKSAEFEAGE